MMILVIRKRDFDFFETVEWRKRTRKNILMIIVGQQRSGKSYASLKLCEWFDSKFNEDAMCFGMKQFMEFVRTQRRRWILFDEVGVEFDNYQWWSIPNRVMKYVTETYASRQLNLVMTLPHLSGMFKMTRVLCHYLVVMMFPGLGILKGIGTDYINNKMWYPNLQLLQFPYPTKKNVKCYEKKKDEFLSEKSKSWSLELGLGEDAQKMIMLKQKLASGIKGETYRQTLKEYMKLKYNK